MRSFLLSALLIPFVTLGCSTAQDDQPALFVSFDTEEREILRDLLRDELGRGSINFGPEDPTKEAVLSILPARPAPMETRSPAMPELFDIRLGSVGCYLLRRNTETMIPLTDIPCVPQL